MSIVHSNDSSLLISLTYSLTTCTFIPCEGCTFSICTAIGLAAKTGKVTLSSGSWSSRWWALRPQLLRCSWTAKTRSFITSSAFCCALPCEHLSQSPESPGPYSFVKRLFAYQLDISDIRYPIVLYTSLSHSIGLTQYSKLLSTVSCCEERLQLEIQLQTVKLEGKKFARGMIGMANNWQNTANIEKNWQTTIKQPWAIISWCSYALVIARRPPWKNPAPLERPDGGRTQASVSVEVIISPNYITILLKY